MIRNTYNEQSSVLPAYFPGVLFRLLRTEGFTESQLLTDSDLTAENLQDDSFRFTFSQHKRFILNALTLTEDEDLGIKLGSNLNVTSLGILGYAAMSCDNLKAALTTLSRYFSIRAPLLKLTLIPATEQSCKQEHQQKQQAEKYAILEIEETLDVSEIRYFMLSAALSGAARLLEIYTQTTPQILSAELACSAPNKKAQRFAFNVSYNAEKTRIFFPQKLLAQKLALADPQTEQSTKEMCEKLLQQSNPATGIVYQLHRYIESYNSGFPTLEQTAKHFCVSSRTLRRELKQANTSFRQQLNLIKRDIAISDLLKSNKTIYQIAFDLGYNDLPNFGRAFKSWTGKTPSEFR